MVLRRCRRPYLRTTPAWLPSSCTEVRGIAVHVRMRACMLYLGPWGNMRGEFRHPPRSQPGRFPVSCTAYVLSAGMLAWAAGYPCSPSGTSAVRPTYEHLPSLPHVHIADVTGIVPEVTLPHSLPTILKPLGANPSGPSPSPGPGFYPASRATLATQPTPCLPLPAESRKCVTGLDGSGPCLEQRTASLPGAVDVGAPSPQHMRPGLHSSTFSSTSSGGNSNISCTTIRHLYGFLMQACPEPGPEAQGLMGVPVYCSTSGPWPCKPNCPAAAVQEPQEGDAWLHPQGVLLHRPLPDGALLPFSVWLGGVRHVLVAVVPLTGHQGVRLSDTELAALRQTHHTLACLGLQAALGCGKAVGGEASAEDEEEGVKQGPLTTTAQGQQQPSKQQQGAQVEGSGGPAESPDSEGTWYLAVPVALEGSQQQQGGMPPAAPGTATPGPAGTGATEGAGAGAEAGKEAAGTPGATGTEKQGVRGCIDWATIARITAGPVLGPKRGPGADGPRAARASSMETVALPATRSQGVGANVLLPPDLSPHHPRQQARYRGGWRARVEGKKKKKARELEQEGEQEGADGGEGPRGAGGPERMEASTENPSSAGDTQDPSKPVDRGKGGMKRGRPAEEAVNEQEEDASAAMASWAVHAQCSPQAVLPVHGSAMREGRGPSEPPQKRRATGDAAGGMKGVERPAGAVEPAAPVANDLGEKAHRTHEDL